MGRAERWALDMAAAERSMERIYARWDDLRDPDDDATINEWEGSSRTARQASTFRHPIARS